MKYLFPCLFFAVICTIAHAQTIRRVNNNPGVTGVNVYATAQAAHDAASANDILMIEPSATSYGNLTLTKPLKIYGNGHWLEINTELKVDQRSSVLNLVYFDTGSGGSEIYGITVSGTGDIHVHGVSNITIQRCYFGRFLRIHTSNVASTQTNNVANIIISGNFGSSLVASPSGAFTISNVLIANNILGDMNASSNPNVQNWVVKNNTFYASAILLVNSIFENNLLAVSAAVSFNNVTYSYNVSAGGTFSGGIGNQNSVAVSSELIGTGAGISADEAYQIKAGSPLKTAGSAGTEVGAYGGATPYVVSGIPAIPSITNMNNTATGSNTVPLQVTISVKGNN